jgi:hypothetical protein
VRETETDLLLRDAEDREIAVPLNSIDEQRPGASLMPAGLVERLTRSELVDLAAFLSALGRTPEFTLPQTSIARRWDVLKATPEAHHQFHRNGLHAAARDNPAFQWTRAYSRVNGEFDVAASPDLRMLGQSRDTRGLSFLRCELDAPAAGSCQLAVNDSTGLRCWIDEQPVELKTETPVELAAGTRRITVAVDQALRTTPLKIWVLDPGSSAARFAGGK